MLFLYWDFFEDIFTTTEESMKPANQSSWTLIILLVLLWISIVFSQITIGITILSQGRDKLFGCGTGHLRPYQKRLFACATCLLGPAILLHQNAKTDSQIHHHDKKLRQKIHDFVEQRSELSAQLVTEAELMEVEAFKTMLSIELSQAQEEHERLVASHRQLGLQLAVSCKNFILLEAVPQILFKLLIAINTTSLGFLGVQELDVGKFVLYVSFIWSLKLSSSYFYRQKHSVGFLGKALLYPRTYLEVGSLLAALTLYWAPFLGFLNTRQACHTNSSQSLMDTHGDDQILLHVTTVTFGDHLGWLLIVLSLHVVIVTTVKMTSKSVSSSHGFLHTFTHSLVHALGSLLFFTPCQDWDRPLQEPGHQDWNMADMAARIRAVRGEYWVMEALRLVESCLLLGWCWCLFPSSDQLRLWYYGGSLVGLILLGLVKVGLFELYNERGHPWARPMEEGHQFKDD